MNFQQLRIVRETARRNFNLTEVANALYTSQSGVSKHIKDLEDELGVELFVRRGKRLLGTTEPGREVLRLVERMLLDAKNLRQLADQFANRETGSLVVATTHTQARYSLPEVVRGFKAEFPKVHLELHQASPRQIVAMLQTGEADIGMFEKHWQSALLALENARSKTGAMYGERRKELDALIAATKAKVEEIALLAGGPETAGSDAQ